jgi:hypothetical protein
MTGIFESNMSNIIKWPKLQRGKVVWSCNTQLYVHWREICGWWNQIHRTQNA